MRTIEEIKAEICGLTTNKLEAELWLEWFRAVANGIEPDRLEAICQAERDGRCVMLPCKVGQIIWFIGIDYTKCSAYGEEYDDVSCAGCEKECDSQKTYNVYATKAESLDWILRRTGSFGTTYFITPEAAQAALEGGAK